MHHTTSTLSSKHLAWLVLTVIATGMSPLKQQSWQDYRIFSLWSVRQATPFIMHLLLPTVPQTHFPVHYGTDGFQAGACCQRQSSFSSVQMLFNRIRRWIWSFSPHMFAQNVCCPFLQLCEGWHLKNFFPLALKYRTSSKHFNSCVKMVGFLK